MKTIVKIECLTVVAMATIFATKIAITGFVWKTATRQLVMDWVWVQILLTPCTKKMLPWQPLLWLSIGYNFGCVIASGTTFDSRGEFLGSSYPMKT